MALGVDVGDVDAVGHALQAAKKVCDVAWQMGNGTSAWPHRYAQHGSYTVGHADAEYSEQVLVGDSARTSGGARRLEWAGLSVWRLEAFIGMGMGVLGLRWNVREG